MENDLTLNPLTFAADLAGSTGFERIQKLTAWERACMFSIALCGDNTDYVVNGLASLGYIRAELRAEWGC